MPTAECLPHTTSKYWKFRHTFTICNKTQYITSTLKNTTNSTFCTIKSAILYASLSNKQGFAYWNWFVAKAFIINS